MNKQQALEFIDSIGGIESAYKKLTVRKKLKPKAEYFAIHPENPHLIQMYARNEPKLTPNYRFHTLSLALNTLEQPK